MGAFTIHVLYLSHSLVEALNGPSAAALAAAAAATTAPTPPPPAVMSLTSSGHGRRNRSKKHRSSSSSGVVGAGSAYSTNQVTNRSQDLENEHDDSVRVDVPDVHSTSRYKVYFQPY